MLLSLPFVVYYFVLKSVFHLTLKEYFYVRYSTLLHLYRPSDSTVSEDAGIEPRAVATLAWTAIRPVITRLDLPLL